MYYFSDVSDEESASYIGVIVVKQKCETHILEYNPEAKNFGSGNRFYNLLKSYLGFEKIKEYIQFRSYNNGDGRLYLLEMEQSC